MSDKNYLVFVNGESLSSPNTTLTFEEAKRGVAGSIQDGIAVDDIDVYAVTRKSVLTGAVSFIDVE